MLKTAIERRQFIRAAAGTLSLPLLARTLSGSSQAIQSQRDGSGAVVIQYRLDQPDAAIFLTHGGRSSLFPLDGSEIQSLVEKYLPLICESSSDRDRQNLNDLARSLYSRLWKPIDSAVPPGSNIFIQGSGILRKLSFESLHNDGPFLGQRFKIRYLVESAVAASGLHLPPLSPGRGLIYAPIDRRGLEVRKLDSARIEAHQIPALLKGVQWTVRIGQQANKSEYTRDVSQPFSVLHIATHGMVDPASGTIGLVLRRSAADSVARRDGIEVLTPAEIRQIELKGRLVVLASCDSGTQRTGASGGTESVGAAFLASGAVEVVVARWTIDDLATTAFMESLYGSLGRGRDTASALRTARASMINSPYVPLRHPHFWAPFASLTSAVFS
jgi:CHAT domain-containing protein